MENVPLSDLERAFQLTPSAPKLAILGRPQPQLQLIL